MRFPLAALVLLAAPLAAHADVLPLKPYDPAVVRVAGRAELYRPPDQARVKLSFYAPGKTANEATEAVSARARALDAAVRAIDAQKTALERTDFSVRPVMKEGGSRRPDKINGYEATAAVTIRVKDLALLARTVEAAVNSSPDTFSDVEFFIDDTLKARTAARKAAIEDAVAKARIYSEGAGYRLGKLLLVEEGGGGMIAQTGNRAIRAESFSRDADSTVTPPPIAPEAQLYTAEVSVVFEVGSALGAAAPAPK
jgi:uncharacterized protein YggE